MDKYKILIKNKFFLKKSQHIHKMIPDYTEHLSEPWFSLILLGLKKVEGRKNKGRFHDMKKGDIIEWYNDDYLKRSFLTKVVDKVQYSSVEEYLQKEGIENCLPGIPSMDHAVSVYYKWSTKEEVQQYGFLAIKLELIK